MTSGKTWSSQFPWSLRVLCQCHQSIWRNDHQRVIGPSVQKKIWFDCSHLCTAMDKAMSNNFRVFTSPGWFCVVIVYCLFYFFIFFTLARFSRLIFDLRKDLRRFFIESSANTVSSRDVYVVLDWLQSWLHVVPGYSPVIGWQLEKRNECNSEMLLCVIVKDFQC